MAELDFKDFTLQLYAYCFYTYEMHCCSLLHNDIQRGCGLRLLKITKNKVFLFESHRARRDRPSSCWFIPQVPTAARAGPVQSPSGLFQVSHMGGCRSLWSGPPFTASLGALTRSWIGSAAGGSCRHCGTVLAPIYTYFLSLSFRLSGRYVPAQWCFLCTVCVPFCVPVLSLAGLWRMVAQLMCFLLIF